MHGLRRKSRRLSPHRRKNRGLGELTLIRSIDVRRDAWLRRPSRLRWFVICLLVIVGVIFAMALPKAIGAAEDGRSSSALGGAAAILALAAPYLYFAGRISRSGVWIGADGIVIRGPLRTRRIPGSSAVSFSPGVQPGAGNGTPCPILARADGSEVGVWALGRESLVWNFSDSLEEMRPLCDELNALLEELYPDHPLPPGRRQRPRSSGGEAKGANPRSGVARWMRAATMTGMIHHLPPLGLRRGNGLQLE